MRPDVVEPVSSFSGCSVWERCDSPSFPRYPRCLCPALGSRPGLPARGLRPNLVASYFVQGGAVPLGSNRKTPTIIRISGFYHAALTLAPYAVGDVFGKGVFGADEGFCRMGEWDSGYSSNPPLRSTNCPHGVQRKADALRGMSQGGLASKNTRRHENSDARRSSFCDFSRFLRPSFRGSRSVAAPRFKSGVEDSHPLFWALVELQRMRGRGHSLALAATGARKSTGGGPGLGCTGNTAVGKPPLRRDWAADLD